MHNFFADHSILHADGNNYETLSSVDLQNIVFLYFLYITQNMDNIILVILFMYELPPTTTKKHQQNADAFKIARFALTLMIDTTNCHHILATTVVGKRRLTL
ncbi:hypothetical protein ACWN9M_07060 [Leuconostoc lactis]